MAQNIVLLNLRKDDLVQAIVQELAHLSNASTPAVLEKELLTCSEVEEYFDISHQTRIDWTKRGVLPKSLKMGSRTYYRACEIQKAPLISDSISSPQKLNSSDEE
jgi:predicted DNA-binding transcriptional regulator AlpA